MMPRNLKNERLKRQYADFLKHADGKAEQTIRQVEKAIQRYEAFTGYVDFRTFDQSKAKGFKADLANHELAKATILWNVTALKRFLGWLAVQPGYKSKISPSDIEFLSLSEKDIRAAKAPGDRAVPTLEQVLHVIESMPAGTAIEKRNRALIAFIAITGTRDGAVVTLRLKHFDPVRNLVIQNPNEVRTKFSKRICSYLLPIDSRLTNVFLDWHLYLKNDLLFGFDDPLFPSTEMGHDRDDCFRATGLTRHFWANATPVRDVFAKAFLLAGHRGFTPHSLRSMLVRIAYERKLPIDQLKAWSQNLGHEGLLTTLTSYGTIPLEIQGQLIAESAAQSDEEMELEHARVIARMIKASGNR
jgi:integrase